MISKIRVLLDYGCYPVWLYDEEGEIIDTLLPEELRSNTELDQKFDDIQAQYESLFINSDKEFSFKGFSSLEEKTRFILDCQLAVDELIKEVNGKYPVINDIHLTFSE